MPEPEIERERRVGSSELLRRLERLERLVHALESSGVERGEQIFALRNEIAVVKNLIEREDSAYRLFQKMVVGIGDKMHYEHDTITLIDNEQRSALRRVIRAEQRRGLQSQLRSEKFNWLRSRTGLLIALVSAVVLLLNAFTTINNLVHR